MITRKNKKNSTWHQGVTWLFVFLLTGSFLFGENVLAVGDYSKADGSRLDPAEWNNLVTDFVNTWQTASMTGPLGIGTADPGAYKLNVNGNTNINGILSATSFNGSYLGTLNAANISMGDFGSNTGGGNYSFSGRVGIGTTNPLSPLFVKQSNDADGIIVAGNTVPGAQFKMYINSLGNPRFESIGTPQGIVFQSDHGMYFRAVAGDAVRFNDTTNAQTIINSGGGNVGIGTTNPQTILHIQTANGTGSSTEMLRLVSGGGGNADGTGSKITFWSDVQNGFIEGRRVTAAGPSRALIFGAGTAEDMRINESGFLGIGTTNPGAKLHILSGAGVSPSVLTGTQAIFQNNAVTTDRTRLSLISGATGASSLDFGNATSQSRGYIFYDNSTDRMTLGSALADVLNIIGGNVGIGTTGPASKLTVAGGDFELDNNKSIKISSAAANTTLLIGNYADGQGFAYGSTAPNKSASLAVEGDVKADRLCIEEDCKAAWSEIVSAGGGNQWTTSGVNILNANTGGVAIGTSTPGAYKLYVNGNTNINGTLTATNFSGTYSGTIGAANVSSGAFASNTGSGNFSFPGRIGIGTTAPSDILDIEPNYTANTGFVNVQTNYAGPFFVGHEIGASYGTANPIFQAITDNSNGASNYFISGVAGGVTNFSVRADGLGYFAGGVGLGTNSLGGNKLNIVGSIRSEIAADGNFITMQATGQRVHYIKRAGQILQFTSDAPNTYDLQLDASNKSIYLASNDGAVGINTKSIGAYKLNVNGDTNITGNLNVTGSISGSGLTGITVNAGNVSAGAFASNLGGGNFSFPGSLGIGTTNPATKLDIGGGLNYINTGASYQISSSTAKIIQVRDASQSALNLISDTDTNGGVVGSILFSRSQGQPDAHYNIAGIRAVQTNGGGLAINRGGQLEFWTKFSAQPSVKMIINETGNVGIGTTTPGSYKLFVNGDTNIAGNLNVTGSITGGAAMTGTLNAGNVSAGAFASNTGGGNFSFSGNVGIGTTAMTSKLNVSGDIRTIGGQLYLNSGDVRLSANILDGNGNLIFRGFQLGSTFWSDGITTTVFNIGTNGTPVYFGTGSSVVASRMMMNTSGFQINSGAYTTTAPVGLFEVTDGTNKLFNILANGNIGIGTTSPTEAKLVINAGTGMAFKAYGDGVFTGTLQTQTGSDFAEEFSTTEDLEPGTVVVMGDGGYKSVRPCDKEYDNTVVGIVSNNPSIIAGRVISKHKAIIAMMGVVKVKVIDINGRILKGDMLTTSGISGYAMKVDGSKPGTVIGKALENLNKKSGEINVLVNLQ